MYVTGNDRKRLMSSLPGVVFHPGGTEFDPRHNINLCFVPDCQSITIHNINIIHIVYMLRVMTENG